MTDNRSPELRAVLDECEAAQALLCQRTGNPCGTDAWETPYTCPCRNCRQWLTVFLPSSISKIQSVG